MNCGSRMVRSGMVGGMVGYMGVGCKGDSHGHNGDGSDLDWMRFYTFLYMAISKIHLI